MFSAEKNQVDICLLKSNLEEIENELVVQRSAWPNFDAENDRKLRESLSAVRVSRTLSVEIEKLNQENVRLVAKRMHLQMQSEEMAKSLEKARKESNDVQCSSNQEKQEIELLIRKYEDLLREKTSQFRKTSAYYNEDEMRRDIEKISEINTQLDNKVTTLKSAVEEMKFQIESLKQNIPENLLSILGKNDMNHKHKLLSEKYHSLQEKRNDLMNNRNNALFFAPRK